MGRLSKKVRRAIEQRIQNLTEDALQLEREVQQLQRQLSADDRKTSNG